MDFAALVPEFYVSNYKESLRFYTEVVGFTTEYTRENPSFALLSLANAQIMIQQIEPTDQHTATLEKPYGRGVNFEIETDDVDALAQRLNDAGVELMMKPTDFTRQTGDTQSTSRELRVLDPDGYYLRFSQ